MGQFRSFSVIAQNEFFIIIDKHPGLSLGVSTDINEDILPGIRKKNPQQFIQPIYELPKYIGGIGVLAKSKESFQFFKNLYGSYQFQLTFTLIAKNCSQKSSQLTCSLPIAQHFSENRQIISHSTGKKAQTQFSLVENLDPFSIWEASTSFVRKDQIRLHSYESGIFICGDLAYSNTETPSLSFFQKRVKPNRKGRIEALYPYPCIHLSKIKIQLPSFDPDTHGWLDSQLKCFLKDTSFVEFYSPLPQKLQTFIKIIRKWKCE